MIASFMHCDVDSLSVMDLYSKLMEISQKANEYLDMIYKDVMAMDESQSRLSSGIYL